MISAIVLTKNSSRSLHDCLYSLSFADEIIVADDGSADTTREIAKRQGASWYSLSPTPSFAEKRNEAAKHAQYDWILFIDSDEVVSTALARHITAATNKDNPANGYYIKRTDVFLGKKLQFGETGDMWLLRLAKKGSGQWKRAVHEYWDIEGKTEQLNGELLHFAHPNIEGFIDKINTYTEIEVQERAKETHKPILLLQLVFYPLGKFAHNYLFRFGFLDGIPGFIMAWMMSFHSLCVRIKLLESSSRF